MEKSDFEGGPEYVAIESSALSIMGMEGRLAITPEPTPHAELEKLLQKIKKDEII